MAKKVIKKSAKKKIVKKKAVKNKKIFLKKKKSRAKAKKSIIYSDSLPVLVTKLPKDKYVEAIQLQKHLKEEQEQARKKIPVKLKKSEQKKEYNKLHLWLLVFATFSIIFIVWIFTLRYDFSADKTDEDHSFPEISNDFIGNFKELTNSIGQLGDNVEKLENSANQNSNKGTSLKSAPKNLNTEEMKNKEEELFPKLK